MCENEIQIKIEIEKGNPKTIMNLNDKKNLINRDSVLTHQHCRIRLFFRRLYFIRHVKERQCRWQNWTTLKDGVCSWLSAAHSLRCFERKKNRLERKREHKWPKVWPFLFKCICLLGTDLWKSQSRVLCSSCFVAIIWSVRI